MEDKKKPRLSNISHFMGNLNQTLARMANKEDDCKRQFREPQIILQAILVIDALLRTMCYVDLNPVRAKDGDCTTKIPLYLSQKTA